MTGLTLREAFRRMITRKDSRRPPNMSRQLLYDYRQRVAQGDYPRDETMRDMLQKAGWKCVVQERWAE